jgi:hypothetical protein
VEKKDVIIVIQGLMYCEAINYYVLSGSIQIVLIITGIIVRGLKYLLCYNNVVNKRKFFGSRGGSCECICHKRADTNDFCGYCSGSHLRTRRY